jgi:hypothetical protein
MTEPERPSSVRLTAPDRGVPEPDHLIVRTRRHTSLPSGEKATALTQAEQPRSRRGVLEPDRLTGLACKAQYDAQDQHDLRNHSKKPPNRSRTYGERERERGFPKTLFGNQNQKSYIPWSSSGELQVSLAKQRG